MRPTSCTVPGSRTCVTRYSNPIFHDLKNRLKYFYIRFRIRRDIRIFNKLCGVHPTNDLWYTPCNNKSHLIQLFRVFPRKKTKNNNKTTTHESPPKILEFWLLVHTCTVSVHCSKGNEVWRGFRDNTRNSLWYHTKIGKTNSLGIMNYFFSYLWIPASLHILFTSVQCTLFMVFTLNHVKETIVIMNIPSAMNRLSSENNNKNYWKPKSLYFLSMYS